MMRGKSNKTTISFLLLKKKMTKGEIENDKGEKTRPPTPCPQAQGSFPAGGEVCLAEDRVSVRPQD